MNPEEELKTFKFISDHANDAHFLLGRDAGFFYVNKKACSMFGYSEEEFRNLRVPDVDIVYDLDKYHKLFDLIQKQSVPPVETVNKRKDGSLFPAEVVFTGCSTDGKPFLFASLKDITERKEAEKALRKAYAEADIRARIRTVELSKVNKNLLAEINERKEVEKELLKTEEKLMHYVNDLEQTNTALKVLLNEHKSDQSEFKGNILSNVKHLISPCIEKLRKVPRLSSHDRAYLDLLESNLNELVSPFSNNLTSHYLGLSPKEIRVADLIKAGKHDKDIAEILHISIDTVKSHRQNIRKKLGLYGKRSNLRTHLLTLSK